MAALTVIIKHSSAQSISMSRLDWFVSRELIARKNNIDTKYFEISKNQPIEGDGYITLLIDIATP
jgi:hypothetical protein